MIRLGVIGLGHRSSGMVAVLRRLDPQVALAVVADTDEPGARQRCAQKQISTHGTRFVRDVDALLSCADQLDALMIGTRCDLHTPIAVACAQTGLPLFLEKAIAINDEQLRTIASAYRGKEDRVVVSFPLRFTPLFDRVRAVIRSGRLGAINQVQAFNYVPYGGIYFGQWYRSFDQTGGLWTQKATHDFDYLHALVDSPPTVVAATGSRRAYGGAMPDNLRCSECDLTMTCPESPQNIASRGDDGGMGKEDHFCAFSKAIKHHDAGSALISYENGVHVSYCQNFVSRRNVGSRGARITGYLATLHFDWMEQAFTVFEHHGTAVERHNVSVPEGHFGGDTHLAGNFLNLSRGEEASRAPLTAGIVSTATCLAAQRSEENRTFEPVRLPGE